MCSLPALEVWAGLLPPVARGDGLVQALLLAPACSHRPWRSLPCGCLNPVSASVLTQTSSLCLCLSPCKDSQSLDEGLP